MERKNRIEGKQVYLRPITRRDTDLIIRWRNREEVRRFFIYQEPFTAQGHEKWLKEMIDSKRGYQFIICLKENDEPVGSTYLRDYDPLHNKAEFGFFLGSSEVRGRGIGSESLMLTLEFAFGELKLHKVFARAFSDNQASINSFLKCSFEKEACLREEVRINGSYRDIVLLARLNPED